MERTIKTIRLLSAAALFILAASACKQEEVCDSDAEVLLPRVIRIQASAPLASERAGDTKVDIASDDGAFTWSASDAIAVCSSTGAYTTFNLDEGEGTGSAVFSNVFTGTRAYYAVYPASIVDADHYGNTTLKVNLPSSYTIDNTMAGWTAYYSTYSPLPMVASNLSSGALEFHHLCGVFRITLNNVPQYTKSIVVTMDKNISGSFTVNSPGTADNYITNSDGNSPSVTFTLASALEASTDGIVLNLPVPVGNASYGVSYGSLNVTCKSGSSASLSSATADLTRSFDRAGGRKIAFDCAASDSRMANFNLSNLTVSPGTAQSAPMSYTATSLSETTVTGVSGFGVTASSSDESVATVSVTANVITVTGIKNGTSTITATAHLGKDKITKTATVTVRGLGSAAITPSSTGVQAGKTVTLNAALTDAVSTAITADSYAWSITSGSSLASLSSTSGSGVTLTAGSSAGSVTVQCIATAGSLTKTATQSITISKASVTISPATSGQTDVSSNTNMTLNASVSGLGTASVSSWTWTSGTTSVATVSYTTSTASSNSATVTFAGAGSSTITAMATLSDGTVVSKTYSVYGRTLTISGDAGVGNNNTGASGAAARKTLTATLNAGTASSYSWASSATSKITVSGTTSTGTLTYVAAGSATITATINTAGGATVTGTKTISSYAASLSGNSSVDVGSTITLTPAVTNSGSLSGSWSWTSSNTSYATVSSSGVVTGKAAGTVTITAVASTTNGASVKVTKSITVEGYPLSTVAGEFTVSSGGQKVYFAKGNLRWTGSKFEIASTQYYYNTTTTRNWSSEMNVFPYYKRSTTSGAKGTITSYTSSDYVPSGGNTGTLTAAEDWGSCVASTGSNPWRTLTFAEWDYLLKTRTAGGKVNTTSTARYTEATINTDGTAVNGLIIFPDGVDFASGEATWGTINGTSAWGTKCTSSQWTALEAKGCVFLPAAGDVRYNSGWTTSDVGSIGHYWSSVGRNANVAYHLRFNSGLVYPTYNEGYYRYYGFSVRLVQNK